MKIVVIVAIVAATCAGVAAAYLVPSHGLVAGAAAAAVIGAVTGIAAWLGLRGRAAHSRTPEGNP
jgi:hypothetical protein